MWYMRSPHCRGTGITLPSMPLHRMQATMDTATDQAVSQPCPQYIAGRSLLPFNVQPSRARCIAGCHGARRITRLCMKKDHNQPLSCVVLHCDAQMLSGSMMTALLAFREDRAHKVRGAWQPAGLPSIVHALQHASRSHPRTILQR